MSTNTRGPIRASVSNIPKVNSVEKKPLRWKAADSDWHPDIKGLYNSLKRADHFDDFQESDMYFARIIASEHSEAMYAIDKNAALLKLIFEQWKELGATLGTRRRLAIEVEKVREDKKAGETMAALAASIISGKPKND